VTDTFDTSQCQSDDRLHCMIRDQQEATLHLRVMLFMALPSGCPFGFSRGENLPGRSVLQHLAMLASPKIRMLAR
jgi:hypothetical protein